MDLSTQTGLSITQLVLAYLQSHPFTTNPIGGCKTLAHLQDSLSAADVQLGADQITYLEQG